MSIKRPASLVKMSSKMEYIIEIDRHRHAVIKWLCHCGTQLTPERSKGHPGGWYYLCPTCGCEYSKGEGKKSDRPEPMRDYISYHCASMLPKGATIKRNDKGSVEVIPPDELCEKAT